MNVGIFETEHFEGAYPVIKLFDIPKNKLFIVTNHGTYDKFRDLFGENLSRYTWFVKSPGDNKYRFIIKAFDFIKRQQIELLYLNTISDNHLIYALMLRSANTMRVIMTVHDINCFFETQLEFGARKFIQHIGKRALQKYIDEYNVVADTMVPYLKTKLPPQVRVHSIPGAVYEHRQIVQHMTVPLRIIVPGSIDVKRRDYAQVFELAKELSALHIKTEITLAGAGVGEYGREILDKAKHFVDPLVQILTYPDFVPQSEFDRGLDESHFVFIPSVIHTTICYDIPEIYGQTKSSGNIFDVIKHAKPYLIPAGLVIPGSLRGSGMIYSNTKAIGHYLKSLFDNKEEYERLQRQAEINSNKFTPEKIRADNYLLFGTDQLPKTAVSDL